MLIISIIFLTFLFLSANFLSTDITSEYIYPTSYISISSYYGNRELYGQANFHTGIDFLAPINSEVLASSSGYVEFASFSNDGYGNTIIISHDNGIKTLYSHLSENFIVSVGQYVSSGEVIGYVGPKYLSNGILNGNTTGPHLHFSIFVDGNTVDPLEFLQ